MGKEMEQKIAQLQLAEQNLQNILAQKQQFQTQLFEVENAIKELESLDGKAYKIVGPIMVSRQKGELQKELSEKKSIIELRIKSIEKQEGMLKEKASGMQSEIMKELKHK